MKVAEILKLKGNILFTVSPQTSMQQAVETMAERDMGSLVVVEAGKLVGMLTFREVMHAIHSNRGAVGAGTVREHMDTNPLTITPETNINDVRRLMLEHHARYVPVTNGSELLGVISFYDVAKAVFETQSFENKMLKSYIQNWPAQAEE